MKAIKQYHRDQTIRGAMAVIQIMSTASDEKIRQVCEANLAFKIMLNTLYHVANKSDQITKEKPFSDFIESIEM